MAECIRESLGEVDEDYLLRGGHANRANQEECSGIPWEISIEVNEINPDFSGFRLRAFATCYLGDANSVDAAIDAITDLTHRRAGSRSTLGWNTEGYGRRYVTQPLGITRPNDKVSAMGGAVETGDVGQLPSYWMGCKVDRSGPEVCGDDSPEV